MAINPHKIIEKIEEIVKIPEAPFYVTDEYEMIKEIRHWIKLYRESGK